MIDEQSGYIAENKAVGRLNRQFTIAKQSGAASWCFMITVTYFSYRAYPSPTASRSPPGRGLFFLMIAGLSRREGWSRMRDRVRGLADTAPFI